VVVAEAAGGRDRIARAVRHHAQGDLIPEGVRNISLTSIAGRLRWEGLDAKALRWALYQVNASRCVPPLPACEVNAIARSIGRKPAGGGRGAVPREQYEAAKARILELAGFVLAIPWRGRTAATDRAVMLVMLRIGWSCGRDRFRASVRRVAEEAGIGRTAVNASLRRLVRIGWLVVDKHGTTSWEFAHLPPRGTIWRLAYPPFVMRQTNDNKTREVVLKELLSAVCRTGNGDVWRNQVGLGKSAERVFEALTAGTQAPSARRLAGELHMVPRTVERALVRLEAHGLARQDQGGWHVTGRDPGEIAPSLPSFGTLERQKAQHEHERRRFERQRIHQAAKIAGAKAGRKPPRRAVRVVDMEDRRAELARQAAELRATLPPDDWGERRQAARWRVAR